MRLGVVNISGNLFMRRRARRCSPRPTPAVARAARRADHVLVDIHAEATSEKVGMGWHLDGASTAVVGTHTHVPTTTRACSPAGPPTSPTWA